MTSADFNIDPVGSGPYQFDQLIVENGQIQEGDYILMVAFGAGFTWASAVVQW